MRRFDKYDLYERAVQSPDVHAEWYETWYKELHDGQEPRRLREDFCGTFAVACEWVKRHPKNTALALDLEQECLEIGRKRHWSKLSSDEKKRVRPLRKNASSVTTPASDVIVAANFSFNVFFTRRDLVTYFRNCLRSLRDGGMVVLEMAGGPGMIEKTKDRETIKDGKKPRFQYIWDQKSYDPITHEADYAIHFKLQDGTLVENAFTYHWRLWTIRELREAFEDAGFDRTVVYWETSHKGEGTGEFAIAERGTNDHSWGAYVVALKD